MRAQRRRLGLGIPAEMREEEKTTSLVDSRKRGIPRVGELELALRLEPWNLVKEVAPTGAQACSPQAFGFARLDQASPSTPSAS